MGEVIQQVIERYGRYDASLERQFIQSQQIRKPRPMVLKPVSQRPNVARSVARFLAKRSNEWWTLQEISRSVRGSMATVNSALVGMVGRREVERERAAVHGGTRVGQPQRYRWIGK